MSSGQRRIIANQRERLVSPDTNRLQAFAAADRASLLSFLYGTNPSRFELGGALDPTGIPSSVGNPLQGDVYEGLLPIPQNGTTSFHIVPGVVGLWDPDGQAGSSQATPASPDDSPYKVVVDPTGITANGVLTLTANAGAVRIDIIECQRSELVIETDARDIFNTATGAFAPQTVDKVAAARLTYRIRLGTPGGGFPGTVQGWLPLAVLSVPGGAALTDAVTIWDVRPLVAERFLDRGGLQDGMPLQQANMTADPFTSAGHTRVSGTVWGVGRTGYWTGGRLAKGTPTAVMGTGDVDYVDLRSTDNQDPFFGPAANQAYYLWLCFPAGLPRWARYAEVAATRLPNRCRGIPVVSLAPSNSMSPIQPAVAITMPTITGLAIDTTFAVLIASGFCSGAAVPSIAWMIDGDWTTHAAAPTVVSSGTPGNLTTDTFHLVAGVDFPRNARAVRLKFQANIQAAANFDYDYQIQLTDASGNLYGVVAAQSGGTVVSGGNPMFVTAQMDVPRLVFGLGSTAGGADLRVKIAWSISGAARVKSGEVAQVMGWKAGG